MEVINICELEVMLNTPSIREKILDISTILKDEKVPLAKIDLTGNTLTINTEFIDIEEKDKRTKIINDNKFRLVDALIRASILKPDLEKFKRIISQWDDVIFGLDTNLFYTCTITSCLLDEVLKIPSGDFIDTPDWVTLVLSKVGMGEIENRAGYSKSHSDQRRCLRAIQEIMILNRSKDLEGVSMFLTGLIPPEIDFAKGGTHTVRDSTIREHFRLFLKNLDFHKGSYFLTQDFNSAVLAEAEGLNSLYIKKPDLTKANYTLDSSDKVNVSEVLYELSVSFQPLIVVTDGLKILVHSNWKGKTLEDWENWQIGIEYEVDELGIQEEDRALKEKDIVKDMLEGWKQINERHVKWLF